ncbi:DUF4405 domain-containing protein [Oricola nitratireducens]|uniref:DUF4405 domain-containing protein n=1 Tax=Oricola nitratireducens TaxID=2775868 RepID=UPI001868D3C5|nr:DUF4405 domain-containing protein [Oricola nitratireducens]
MPPVLSRYATPLITGLFVVSLISGIAMFFHLGEAQLKEMHEWLGTALVVPFVLHLWRNWKPFSTYFKRPAMKVALAASLVAAAAFVVPTLTATGPTRNGPPEMAAARALQAAPLTAVAPVFGHDGEGLADVLRAKGYTVASADQSLNAVAEASGKSAREILTALPMAN